jgi:hypothetical protein
MYREGDNPLPNHVQHNLLGNVAVLAHEASPGVRAEGVGDVAVLGLHRPQQRPGLGQSRPIQAAKDVQRDCPHGRDLGRRVDGDQHGELDLIAGPVCEIVWVVVVTGPRLPGLLVQQPDMEPGEVVLYRFLSIEVANASHYVAHLISMILSDIHPNERKARAIAKPRTA